MLGVPPTQILTQQISHLAYAASGEGGLSGALKGAAGAVLSFVNPTTALVAGLTAATAGSYLLYSSIKQTELQFGELADRSGAAITQLHALQSAAAFKGIGQDDFLKGLEGFSEQTSQAKDGLGSLASLLRANGAAAGTLEQNLGSVADLVRNAASEADRYRIVQQAGLPATQQWVTFLKQGSDGIRDSADSAVRFGGVASEQMISKAKQAEERWDTFWKSFADGGKAAFMQVISGFESLTQKATQAGAAMHPRMFAINFEANMNALQNTGTAADRALRDGLEREAAKRRGGGSTTKLPDVSAADLGRMNAYIGLLGQLATVQQHVTAAENQVRLARLAGVPVSAEDEARIKSLAEAQALGTFAIRQQTDSQKIDAQTVGISVGQAAAFRAEQEKLADFRQRGITLTDRQAAALHAEAQALGAATQAAAERRLQDDILFERSQIGRSPDEQQIAARLRSTFGDNYATNDNAQRLGAQMRGNFELQFQHDTALQGIKDFNAQLRQGASAGEAFGTAVSNALGKIEDRLVEMIFNDMWTAAFGGKSGAGGIGLLSILGLQGSGAGGDDPTAAGAGGDSPAGFASGGYTGNVSRQAIAGVVHGREFVVNAEQTAKHFALLQAINDNKFPGYARGGYVGSAPTIGSGYGPPPTARPANGNGGSGPAVEFHLHEAPGVTTTAKTSQRADGGERVDLVQSMKDTAVQAIGEGGADNVQRQRYGLQRLTVRR